MAQRLFAIFYIEASKGYFYGSNSTSILQVDIPADTMSYFDVLNKDKFYQIIQALVTTNKIEPAPLLILISPFGTYEKDLPGKASESSTIDIQQFLDAVPFEKILSRTYKLQDGTKVVAANKDLYEAIKHGFEKVQFSIVGVVSVSLLQKMIPDLGTTVNLEMIANKFDTAKQYSFITIEEINNPGRPTQQEAETNKPNPVRLYGLIGVFVVLIVILIVMAMTMLQSPQKPMSVKQQAAPVAFYTPIPTTAPTSSIQVTKPAQRSITGSQETLR